jgi:hypothetical protein
MGAESADFFFCMKQQLLTLATVEYNSTVTRFPGNGNRAVKCFPFGPLYTRQAESQKVSRQ